MRDCHGVLGIGGLLGDVLLRSNWPFRRLNFDWGQPIYQLLPLRPLHTFGR